MPEPDLRFTGDPTKDLIRLLGALVNMAEDQQAMIKLMEVPPSRWRVRSHAMEVAKDTEAKAREMLATQTQVQEALATLGY